MYLLLYLFVDFVSSSSSNAFKEYNTVNLTQFPLLIDNEGELSENRRRPLERNPDLPEPYDFLYFQEQALSTFKYIWLSCILVLLA